MSILCETKGNTLMQRLSHIERMQRISNKNEDFMQGVTLSTLHSSKGKEWHHVWMPFFNHDVLPYKKASSEHAKEEERRLAVVGMTRAIKRLVLSANEYSSSEFLLQMDIPSTSASKLMNTSVLD